MFVNIKPPETGSGASLGVVLVSPFPSSPLALLPQQYAAPAVVTAQVCWSPLEIALNANPPATATGTDDDGVVMPAPSSPLEFAPQQKAAPDATRAHPPVLLTESDVYVLPPATGTGV